MLCLGIESSCDETALALVEDGRLIAETLASQAPIHSLFGGVVPELASREHYRFIGPLFDQLFARCACRTSDLDAIAVARGPGLLGSLLVGMAFAKGLALALGTQIIGVNHLHAHLLAAGLDNKLAFPALGLLVSGGHTHIYRIESPWQFIQLGRTLDDAAGEAFDKIGSVLGMPYPAGKQIDERARRGHADPKLLPRPFLDSGNLDFSFSGLKTAAVNLIRGQKGFGAEKDAKMWSPADVDNFCASLNLAIADTLAAKVDRALQENPDTETLILAGGVAANGMIRDRLAALALKHGKMAIIPKPALCTDNAAMIAYAGYLLARAGFSHSLEVESIPRGKKIPEDLEHAG